MAQGYKSNKCYLFYDKVSHVKEYRLLIKLLNKTKIPLLSDICIQMEIVFANFIKQ